MRPLKTNYKQMKTKYIMFLGLICLIFSPVSAQKPVSKLVKHNHGQSINLYFAYPELIKVTTWDRDEIEVTGTASINNGKNDDSFDIKVDSESDVLFISSIIKDHDKLPRMKVVVIGDTKYYFDNENDHQAINRLKEERGSEKGSYTMHGVIKEINLAIKVPKNIALVIESKHGLVELNKINAPVKVISKFGGIDISISENAKRNLEISTRFGEIYTNMDMEFDKGNRRENNHWTIVKSQLNGGGNLCELESKFGNIYVRKDK